MNEATFRGFPEDVDPADTFDADEAAYLVEEAERAAAQAAAKDHDIWNCDCTGCAVERMEARV